MFYRTIERDYIMIAAPVEASFSVPPVNIGHMEVPARHSGGAVDYNSIESPHLWLGAWFHTRKDLTRLAAVLPW